jgi:hypothetical protein
MTADTSVGSLSWGRGLGGRRSDEGAFDQLRRWVSGSSVLFNT